MEGLARVVQIYITCDRRYDVGLIPKLGCASCLEGSLKCCIVLVNNAWSLGVEIVWCRSEEVKLMEGGSVGIFLEKWQSVSVIEFLYIWPCEHTLSMTLWQDPSNQQDNMLSAWPSTGLFKGESNKCDSSNRHSENHDETFVTVPKTFYMSVMDV